jgi:hypothetical protein
MGVGACALIFRAHMMKREQSYAHFTYRYRGGHRRSRRHRCHRAVLGRSFRFRLDRQLVERRDLCRQRQRQDLVGGGQHLVRWREDRQWRFVGQPEPGDQVAEVDRSPALAEMACSVEHRSVGKGPKGLANHSNSECTGVR